MGTTKTRECPLGKPKADYSCKFCHVYLHRGDSDCGCSELRREVTHYASLCHECAAAVDVLMADTPVGKVHRALARQAWFDGRGPGDD